MAGRLDRSSRKNPSDLFAVASGAENVNLCVNQQESPCVSELRMGMTASMAHVQRAAVDLA
jgi:hypothetical protein